MKKKLLTIVAIMILVLSLVGVFVGCTQGENKNQDKTNEYAYGDFAYQMLYDFNNGFPKRQAGTVGEKMAGEFILKNFKDFGYKNTMVQDFTYDENKKSQNIIATKEAKSETSKNIVVGAHYDSVSAGNGIDDNASGIAVMMETAKYVFDKDTNYNIIFIAFGSEEVGLEGSKAYVNSLSEQDIKNIELMINLDTLACGDNMYVYGGKDTKSQAILDNVLKHSSDNKLNITTQQGKNPTYPKGTTGDWSDHAPFKAKGISVLYYESTNWDIGDMDGYTQVKGELGEYTIMHSQFDTLDYIETMFPGRAEAHMKSFATSLINTVLTF